MRQTESTLGWQTMPKQFCNLDRLLQKLEEEGLDGVVLNSRQNVYYMTGFWVPPLQSDENYPFMFVLSRHFPEHPIVVTVDSAIGLIQAHETWIDDIRFTQAILQHDLLVPRPLDLSSMMPFPARKEAAPWFTSALESSRSGQSFPQLVQASLTDLGLVSGKIGIDRYGTKPLVESAGLTAEDAYWVMMSVRSVKTEAEVKMLQRSTGINQAAQEHMVDNWQTGMTWHDTYQFYTDEVRRLGGNTDVPAVPALDTINAAQGVRFTIPSQSDFRLDAGTNIMLDCHGMANGYCWDGGKTWRVGENVPEGKARVRLEHAATSLHVVNAACTAGATQREILAAGRSVLRKNSIAEADDALFYLHGLGLSHLDQDRRQEACLITNEVLATHLYVPGDEGNRIWLEEIIRVTPDGGEAMFSWDYVDWT